MQSYGGPKWQCHYLSLPVTTSPFMSLYVTISGCRRGVVPWLRRHLPASLQQQEAGIFCATALQTSPRLYKKEDAHGTRVRARCNDEVSSMHRRALVNALSSLRPCMDEAPSMQGLSETAVWGLGQEDIKTDKNIRKLIKYLENNKIFDNFASEIKYKACRKWTQERN